MEEIVRVQHKGWTFMCGATGAMPPSFMARIESPDGEVVTRGPFADDNMARQAMAEAKALVLMVLRTKGEGK